PRADRRDRQSQLHTPARAGPDRPARPAAGGDPRSRCALGAGLGPALRPARAPVAAPGRRQPARCGKREPILPGTFRDPETGRPPARVANCLTRLVGETGFEPATSTSRT